MRKPRIKRPGATYHVTSRFNNRFKGFKNPAMKDLFLEVIHQAHEIFSFQLFAFTIMDNHFHLIIKPLGDEDLSKIIGWIKGVFAIRWNDARNWSGHVWGERFYSRIIEDEEEMAAIFRYIGDNPVNAGMVKKPEEWKYSGIWHYRTGNRYVMREIAAEVEGLYRGYMRL